MPAGQYRNHVTWNSPHQIRTLGVTYVVASMKNKNFLAPSITTRDWLAWSLSRPIGLSEVPRVRKFGVAPGYRSWIFPRIQLEG